MAFVAKARLGMRSKDGGEVTQPGGSGGSSYHSRIAAYGDEKVEASLEGGASGERWSKIPIRSERGAGSILPKKSGGARGREGFAAREEGGVLIKELRPPERIVEDFITARN